MTRNQKIILGMAAVFIVAIVLVLTGVLPGLKTPETQFTANLEIWGIQDRASAFEGVISDFTRLRPNAAIRYRELSPDTYEQDLINAVAAGKGPDIFLFHNTWLPKHYDKIVPLAAADLTIENFRNLFPRVAEQDFAPVGTIYALPLYIDTMALLYNKDIFDDKAIALPPKTWPEIQTAISKIRTIKNGKLTMAGAAIGGSGKSINGASGLLSLLMMQTGTEMVDNNFARATFSAKGLQSLNFYAQFANPKNKYYTWNDNFDYSLNAFAQGTVGMIFNYASNFRAIKEKNPFVRMGVAEMPQTTANGQRVDYPNYFGLAVSSRSAAPALAWEFIKFLTLNATESSKYLAAAKHPPALRTLINASLNSDEFGIFARQALTARSWPQIDNIAVDGIFSDMIVNVNRGTLSAQQAIGQSENAVTDLMSRRK